MAGTSQPARMDDDTLLDELFEHIVQQLEDGCCVEQLQLPTDRADLQPAIDRLIQIAQSVAIGAAVQQPQFSGYAILGELGRGGMGTVYLARQERLGGRLVALKTLPAAVVLSPTARTRFRSEALAIARLQHPHVVGVYDIVEEDSVCAYTMEWIDGPSLAGLVESVGSLGHPAPLSSATALLDPVPATAHVKLPNLCAQVGLAIAEALEAVHGQGLLHRDVKPSNILLRRDGTALLSDFGLARAATGSSLTMADSFVGTLAYAAPEQLRGESDRLDASTDVYGLGATLYHAITGHPTVVATSPAEALRWIERGGVASLRAVHPAIPHDLRTIIEKALAPERAQRYSSAGAMAADLRAFLADEPIAARPPSTAYVLRKRMQRHPGWTAFLLTIALVFSGLAGYAAWRWHAALRAKYVVHDHGGGRQEVDVAVLGRYVATADARRSELGVNELRGLQQETRLDGTLAVGIARGRAAGTIDLSDGQRLAIGGALRVGAAGDGTVRIREGATVESQTGAVACGLDCAGVVEVCGAAAGWYVEHELEIGQRGPGTLHVGPAGRVAARDVAVGVGARGVLFVRGADGSLDCESIVVGSDGPGVLSLETAAALTGQRAALAVGVGGTGAAALRGAGTRWKTAEDLCVGERGRAELEVLDGAQLHAANVNLGSHASASGRLTVAGNDTEVVCSKVARIGQRGNGSLHVSAGRLVARDVVLGREAGGHGTGILSGPATMCNVHGKLAIAVSGGSGELTLENEAEALTTWTFVGVNSAAGARLVLRDRGTRLSARAGIHVGGTPFDNAPGLGELEVGPGASVAAEHEVYVGRGGTITLGGGAMATDAIRMAPGGNLDLRVGTLAVRSVTGSLLVRGARLCAAGPPEWIQVSEDLTVERGALRFVLGGAQVGQHDQLRVGGSATLGGQLEVVLTDGFAPAHDTRIQLISAERIRGTFENPREMLELSPGGRCDVEYGEHGVTLTHFQGPFGVDTQHACETYTLLARWEPDASAPFPLAARENTTLLPARVFLGPPDDIAAGLQGHTITFDFGELRIIDGPGPDLSVYEADQGPPEFDALAVLVSADGIQYVDIRDAETSLVRVPGDDACRSDRYARSYDLAGSGLTMVRFVKLRGTFPAEYNWLDAGFDLDAIAAINLEPAQPTH